MILKITAANRVLQSGVLSAFIGAPGPEFYGGPEVQALVYFHEGLLCGGELVVVLALLERRHAVHVAPVVRGAIAGAAAGAAGE